MAGDDNTIEGENGTVVDCLFDADLDRVFVEICMRDRAHAHVYLTPEDARALATRLIAHADCCDA